MIMEVLWTPNGGRLVVELPDYGVLIRCQSATDTFVEIIKRIGIERVKGLKMEINSYPLISTTESPNVTQRKVGEYYIITALNPEDMQRNLRQIAERLDITLYAELFPS